LPFSVIFKLLEKTDVNLIDMKKSGAGLEKIVGVSGVGIKAFRRAG